MTRDLLEEQRLHLAAHDYETDYEEIAEHFNTLYALTPMLCRTARRLADLSARLLGVQAASDEFAAEFSSITAP